MRMDEKERLKTLNARADSYTRTDEYVEISLKGWSYILTYGRTTGESTTVFLGNSYNVALKAVERNIGWCISELNRQEMGIHPRGTGGLRKS